MEEEYIDSQDSSVNEVINRNSELNENLADGSKDFSDVVFEEGYEDEEGGNNFRGGRGRGNFRSRGRGPPPGWMNGPPMRFRGRGYGPGGPPMRGRGFFRGRGGPRGFGPNNGPNFDNNWGPMGPPPPGMMGGPPPGMMGGPPPFGPPPGMMPPGGPMGPPPNMMGQPPPFGGPPGMPPPNMPQPEVWVETKSEEGKPYYYHSRTRETTWTRPQEGPTCKIILQAEMEASAQMGGPMSMPGPQNVQMNGPMGGPMSGPMGMMPNGVMSNVMPPGVHNAPPSGGVPPFMSQPPPWVKEGSSKENKPEEESPIENDDIPPGETAPITQPPNGNMMNFPGAGFGYGGGAPGPSFPGGGAGPGPGFPSGGAGPGPGFPSGGAGPSPGFPSGGAGPGPGFPSGGAGPGPGFQSGGAGPGPGFPGAGPGPGFPGAGAGPGPGFPGGNAGPGPGFPGGNAGPGPGFPGGGAGPGPGFPGGGAGPGPGFPGSGAGPSPGFPGAGAGPGPGFPGASAGPGPGFPGGGAGPGPGFPGGGPGPGWPSWSWPPPLVAQPPPNMGSAAVPDGGAAAGLPPGARSPASEPTLIPDSPPPAKKDERVITPELLAAANEWSSHRAPDGRPYYYNAAKQESVWEKPKPMKELEELRAKMALEKGEKKIDDKIIEIDDGKGEDDIAVIDVEAHAEAKAAAEAEREMQAERLAQAERERRDELERQAQAERDRQEKDKGDKEKEKEKNKQDRSRPISSTPILGTPWCVVWTGDGSVFFYNSAAHSSVWERPAALLARADVDKAVSQPPAALLELQRKDAAVATTSKPNGELKRAADSSTDDSSVDAAKKTKVEEVVKPLSSSLTGGGTIDAGAAAAVEAEVRAARERGALPHQQRLKAFLRMLHEKDVSAFSTWEKELHKIVFDPRYLMLNSKERRQVFDQYVRDRAEEERKEKKNRLQQKKVAFRALMDEAKLHSKSSFNEFTSKHGRDERYKGIDKARERETFFNEFLAELRKKEKEEKDKAREQVKSDFIALLKEKMVDRHSRWMEAKKKIDADPRYKAVESSNQREDYFKEYCKMVKEERKKEKDGKEKKRERSSGKKEKREKERDKEKEKDSKKDKKKEKGEEPVPEEPEEVEAEEMETSTEGEAAAREKEARAMASIKEREREVQRALATSLRDRDKEREYHKRDEAVQHFNALLADLVRNPDLSWRDAKKQLKKDHRYSLAELLTKDDKERLFMQHTSALATKRREKLRSILNERAISCTAHWREVRTILAEEPNAPTYNSASQMEREFRDYQRDKQSAAKTAMRQLLLETRSITHRSLSILKENPGALQHVMDALKHDARYTALDHIAEERQQIFTSYLEELEKKGPPPPPTATEPSRRAKQ